MAETPNPIVWDAWKQTQAADGVGATVHYYDTTAQFLYLLGGLATRTGTIENGDWENNIWNPERKEVDPTTYELISFDHPSNGTLYGVAVDGTSLYFLRYVYSMDISDIVKTGTWQGNNQNEIQQCNMSVANVKNAIFEKERSLFLPGSRVVLKVRLGDSDPYDIGVAHVDEVTHDPASDSVAVSGRNKSGYYLKETYIGTHKSLSGSYQGVLEMLLGLADISDFVIEEKIEPCIVRFEDPKQTVLDSIKEVCEAIGYEMKELPDGRIAIGTPEWIIENHIATGYYQFDDGKEVFKRKSRRVADAAYSQVYIEGKDEDGNDLLPAVFDVPNHASWGVPKKKIYFGTAPQGFNQNELVEYAKGIRDRLQYAGLVEQYDSPFRPQLLIGDVAQVYKEGEDEAVSVGTITSIRHTFGQRGFSTNFTVDSGGVSKEHTGTGTTVENVITKTKNVGGYTTSPRIVDYVLNSVLRRRAY